MKLPPDDFRSHVESMMTAKTKKQLQMWIDHGLLVYVNHEELTEIWDEEYEETFNNL